MSPDWSAKEEPVPYAKLDNPQSLNLYGYVGNNPLARADADGHCWPLCTIIAGAAIGALTGAVLEAGSQYLATGKVGDWHKVGNAALGGLVTGAITGAAGPEAGLAAKAAIGIAGAVSGGVVERGVNGEKALNPKAMAMDAAAGAAGPKVEKIAEKTFATKVLQKVVPKAIDATVDGAHKLTDVVNDAKKEKKPESK